MNPRFALIALLLLPVLPLRAQLTEDARRNLRRTPVVDVFENCHDSVVNISTAQIIEYRAPMGIPDLFQDLFDLPDRQQRVQRFKRESVGSGFILHEAGYVVTNAHVVARTAEQKVIFGNQKEYDAQVIAIDEERDLAVLKIEADHPLKPLPLGHSSDLMVGETVIAIGNPLGYQHTVTSGVVSALHRDLQASENVTFHDLIQTDASINPGNSGGPLLNALGELVGINTAIRADAQNIGFAIPVDQLRQSLPELLDVERRYRIHLGMRVSADEPARVLGVVDHSPAARADVRVGDIVTRLDNVLIRGGVDFYINLIGKQAGQTLDIVIQREGQEGRGKITLEALAKPDGGKLLENLFGIAAATITEQMAQQANLPRLQGLLITAVARGSVGEKAGLRRGDVISHLGRHQLASLDDAGVLLETLRQGQPVDLGILRFRGNTVFRTRVRLMAQ